MEVIAVAVVSQCHSPPARPVGNILLSLIESGAIRVGAVSLIIVFQFSSVSVGNGRRIGARVPMTNVEHAGEISILVVRDHYAQVHR